MSVSVVIIALVALALMAASPLAAITVTGDLLELIDVERAAYLRDSVGTQVSSYDRTGGNDDGFSGAYSHIRKEGEDFVIFDAEGPGCIYRLWSADPHDGWVKFYFDGETTPRLQLEKFRDMFTDKVYPFAPPLSQNFLGGWVNYVPIPFEKSLKIVAGGPVRFLQIGWQRFPGGKPPSDPNLLWGGPPSSALLPLDSSKGIKSFEPNLLPEDRAKLERVKKAWSNLGQPPMPFPKTAKKAAKTVTVGPKSTADLARLQGAGLVRALKMKVSSDDPTVLRAALLLMSVDGRRENTIYCPIGDFFLDPFGGEKAQSLLTGKAADGSYYCYWVMPYASGAAIKIKNEGRAPLRVSYEIVYESMKKLPQGMGRFYAWWHRQNPTSKDQLFPILDAEGRGQWCGVSHAMQGTGLGFLEGDEMAWIDNRDNTYYNGTGTEDYFNGGWYFGATGSAPMYGCGVLDGVGKVHAYRIQLTDLAPFGRTARIGIEHGHGNEYITDYAGVTFWYAATGTKHTFKPVDLIDRVDRPAPAKNVIEAEKVFDPALGGKIVTDLNQPYFLSSGKAVSTAGKSFTLLLDAPNADAYEVEITFIKGPKYGKARILVDGQVVNESVDTRSEKFETGVRTQVGTTQTLGKGQHKLTIESVSGSAVVVDFVVLRPDGVREAELMPVISQTGGSGESQQLGADYGDGTHMFFTAGSVGSELALGFPIRKAGKYPVSAYLTKAADYGIVQLKIDGKPVGEPFDGYNNGVIRVGPVKLGEIELSEGNHNLALEIVGKNDKSSGYLAGIDQLLLR